MDELNKNVEHKKLKGGNAEPVSQGEGKSTPGEWEDACHHGMSRRSLRVKPCTG